MKNTLTKKIIIISTLAFYFLSTITSQAVWAMDEGFWGGTGQVAGGPAKFSDTTTDPELPESPPPGPFDDPKNTPTPPGDPTKPNQSEPGPNQFDPVPDQPGPGPNQTGPGDPDPQPEKEKPSTCHPVSFFNGEETYECIDLTIPGRGMDVSISHFYRSGKANNNQFGYGWTINYYYRLKNLVNGSVMIVSGDGRSDEWIFSNGNYIAPQGIFEKLAQNGNGTWTLTKSHGLKYNFSVNGNLSSIVDRNGNTITLTYDAAGYVPIIGFPLFKSLTTPAGTPVVIGYDFRLTKITDTLGRVINFNYNSRGLLSSIVDFNGRAVSFTYDANTHDL